MNKAESKEWRKMLSPFIVALVALVGACTSYVKAHTEIKNASDTTIAQQAVMMEKVSAHAKDVENLRKEYKSLAEVLTAMREDVAYIRGKMEADEKNYSYKRGRR